MSIQYKDQLGTTDLKTYALFLLQWIRDLWI